jgi:hypothetical protein
LLARSWMDNSASDLSYPLQDVKDVFSTFWTSSRVYLLCERSLLYRLFIQCITVVNLNVSSIKLMHMLNFLGTFSMGVTEID